VRTRSRSLRLNGDRESNRHQEEDAPLVSHGALIHELSTRSDTAGQSREITPDFVVFGLANPLPQG
jgi:hypothetical protein